MMTPCVMKHLCIPREMRRQGGTPLRAYMGVPLQKNLKSKMTKALTAPARNIINTDFSAPRAAWAAQPLVSYDVLSVAPALRKQSAAPIR